MRAYAQHKYKRSTIFRESLSCLSGQAPLNFNIKHCDGNANVSWLSFGNGLNNDNDIFDARLLISFFLFLFFYFMFFVNCKITVENEIYQANWTRYYYRLSKVFAINNHLYMIRRANWPKNNLFLKIRRINSWKIPPENHNFLSLE